MFWHAEKKVVRKFGAPVEDGDSATRIERGHALVRHELDVAFGESGNQRLGGLG